jgi:hypothetical protein
MMIGWNMSEIDEAEIKFKNNTKVRHVSGAEVTIKGYFYNADWRELYYICSFDNQRNQPRQYQYECLVLPSKELQINTDSGPKVVPTELKTPYTTIYGYCPICDSPSVSRERRPNGNDICLSGHTFSSSTVLTKPRKS